MAESPRPIHHLVEIMYKYPDLARLVDFWRAGKGNDLPDWPSWCFVPMAAWASVVLERNGADAAGDIAILGALAPWRYTQGIYRFDPDLFDALIATELTGILPSEIFLRLPQWSIYIEIPEGRVEDAEDTIYGFWASLEWDANSGRQELRLLLDVEGPPIGVPLHLGRFTLLESFRRMLAEAERVAATLGMEASPPATLDKRVAATVAPLLSLLLYICSQEPEIDSEREPGTSPYNPAARRVKTGWRLFPPDKPTVWQVGAGIGQQLRAARTAAAAGEHGERHVRAHVRRGHWHGFWTGPRAPEREAERGVVYHWLPPQVVGGE